MNMELELKKEALEKMEETLRTGLEMEKQALENLKMLLVIFDNLLKIGKKIDPNISVEHENIKELFEKASKRITEIEKYEIEEGYIFPKGEGHDN